MTTWRDIRSVTTGPKRDSYKRDTSRAHAPLTGWCHGVTASRLRDVTHQRDVTPTAEIGSDATAYGLKPTAVTPRVARASREPMPRAGAGCRTCRGDAVSDTACPDCAAAALNPLWPIYAPRCIECEIRHLAHSPMYDVSKAAKRMMPSYRDGLKAIFGDDNLASHMRVKRWADRIEAARMEAAT